MDREENLNENNIEKEMKDKEQDYPKDQDMDKQNEDNTDRQVNGYQNNGYLSNTNTAYNNSKQENGSQNSYQYQNNYGFQNNNGYQNNGYQNNGYQSNGYQNYSNQSNGSQNNGNQSYGFQSNGYQNDGYSNNGNYNNTYQNRNQSNRYNNNGYQYQPYQNGGTSTGGNGGYTGYQYTQPESPKPKKARKAFKVLGFAAAAIAVGLIVGGIYQGITSNQKKGSTEISQDVNNNSQGEKEQNNNKTILNVSIDQTEKSIVGDVSATVENVLPSIVAINSTITTTGYDWFGREFSEEGVGSGSGIIIAQDNNTLLIITNYHVIEDAQIVEVILCDDTKVQATIKGVEPNADLAVLSVKLSDLSEKTQDAIRIASLGSSEDLQVGQTAIAIGNALGYGQSVTVGYISALDRTVNLENKTMNLLQTDAAINPGNSGGALINAYGEVIGINSVKYASTEVESIGYAIPISDAIPIINDLMNRETLEASEQGFLGIDLNSAQEVSEMYGEIFGMPVGIHVGTVIDGSPADKAGLKENSIITAINGKSVTTIEQLKNVLSYSRAGEKITLTVQIRHNGSYYEKELDVTLGNRPVN